MKIIDMHCDTISRLLECGDNGNPQHLEKNDGMVDLSKMKAAGYLLQNFALFVDKSGSISPYRQAVRLLTLFQEEMERCGEEIAQVFCVKDIVKNEEEGKCSALLTIEEGEACEGSMENLWFFYEQGVRMMTLTWNYPNELGFPNYSAAGGLYTPDMIHGLTDTGIDFVREMERIGMIIDVSHLSDAGFYDVLKYTKTPFVASHSNARALCPVVRNLTDDMIRKLAERGGVIGLNYCVDFLREPPKNQPMPSLYDSASWGKGTAAIEDIAMHARHIADVGGVECLGLGSDFDGIPVNPAMPDAGQVPGLFDAFAKAGFHESEIEKICYQNVYRLYRDVLK